MRPLWLFTTATSTTADITSGVRPLVVTSRKAGATNWPECDEDEFNTKLNLAIYKSMTERFALKLEGEKV